MTDISKKLHVDAIASKNDKQTEYDDVVLKRFGKERVAKNQNKRISTKPAKTRSIFASSEREENQMENVEISYKAASKKLASCKCGNSAIDEIVQPCYNKNFPRHKGFCNASRKPITYSADMTKCCDSFFMSQMLGKRDDYPMKETHTVVYSPCHFNSSKRFASLETSTEMNQPGTSEILKTKLYKDSGTQFEQEYVTEVKTPEPKEIWPSWHTPNSKPVQTETETTIVPDKASKIDAAVNTSSPQSSNTTRQQNGVNQLVFASSRDVTTSDQGYVVTTSETQNKPKIICDQCHWSKLSLDHERICIMKSGIINTENSNSRKHKTSKKRNHRRRTNKQRPKHNTAPVCCCIEKKANRKLISNHASNIKMSDFKSHNVETVMKQHQNTLDSNTDSLFGTDCSSLMSSSDTSIDWVEYSSDGNESSIVSSGKKCGQQFVAGEFLHIKSANNGVLPNIHNSAIRSDQTNTASKNQVDAISSAVNHKCGVKNRRLRTSHTQRPHSGYLNMEQDSLVIKNEHCLQSSFEDAIFKQVVGYDNRDIRRTKETSSISQQSGDNSKSLEKSFLESKFQNRFKVRHSESSNESKSVTNTAKTNSGLGTGKSSLSTLVRGEECSDFVAGSSALSFNFASRWRHKFRGHFSKLTQKSNPTCTETQNPDRPIERAKLQEDQDGVLNKEEITETSEKSIERKIYQFKDTRKESDKVEVQKTEIDVPKSPTAVTQGKAVSRASTAVSSIRREKSAVEKFETDDQKSLYTPTIKSRATSSRGSTVSFANSIRIPDTTTGITMTDIWEIEMPKRVPLWRKERKSIEPRCLTKWLDIDQFYPDPVESPTQSPSTLFFQSPSRTPSRNTNLLIKTSLSLQNAKLGRRQNETNNYSSSVKSFSSTPETNSDLKKAYRKSFKMVPKMNDMWEINGHLPRSILRNYK